VAVCLDFVNIFSRVCEFNIRGLLYTNFTPCRCERSFAKGVT